MTTTKSDPSIDCIYKVSHDTFHPFSKALEKHMQKISKTHDALIFLCIGSDRATGDSLGPFVGYTLANASRKTLPVSFTPYHFLPSKQKKMHEASFSSKSYLYGTLHAPVHAINLPLVLSDIRQRFAHPFLIAIDAALGDGKNIGMIHMASGSLFPGIGVNKQLPHVGNMYITGTVNRLTPQNPNQLLQTTHLSTVVDLSNFISNGILVALQKCRITYPVVLPVPDKA